MANGYQLELVQNPSQIVPVARSPTECQAIKAEIQALLIKGAVRKVHLQSDRFFSRLFVVPKDGSLRPVINLKPLNSHMDNQHFKMEGTHKVQGVAKKRGLDVLGKSKGCLPLSSTAERHRKSPQFLWEETTYEFTCLPFGLCNVPRTFTKHRSNIHVLLQMDNRIAAAYVNKMRGTHSLSQSLQACILWQCCLERRILLSAEYLPGVVADQESWFR